MGEPGCHGREYPGGDDPTTQTTEPGTRDEPASQCETGSSEPAAAVPLAVWPRAAGGGAAAVAALILPARAYPGEELTLEPETATAEHAIEPPRSEAVSPDEPGAARGARRPRRGCAAARRDQRRAHAGACPGAGTAGGADAAVATICGRCAERHPAASAGDRAEARGRCRRHAPDCAAATALRLRANAGTRHAMARGAAAAASRGRGRGPSLPASRTQACGRGAACARRDRCSCSLSSIAGSIRRPRP